MINERILHDFKRIARIIDLLKSDFDRLYEDVLEGNKKRNRKKEVKKKNGNRRA